MAKATNTSVENIVTDRHRILNHSDTKTEKFSNQLLIIQLEHV